MNEVCEEIEGELNTMPKGRFPFRRTFEFLSGGKLILKSDIKSVVLNYTHKPESRGLRYVAKNSVGNYYRPLAHDANAASLEDKREEAFSSGN